MTERSIAAYDVSQRVKTYDADMELSDQPLTLAEDLELLRSTGLNNVSSLWLEYRELVSAGQK